MKNEFMHVEYDKYLAILYSFAQNFIRYSNIDLSVSKESEVNQLLFTLFKCSVCAERKKFQEME